MRSFIVEIKFGSHLYGTATPASDLDLKRVHLPDATEILLGRGKPVISTQTKADAGAKNTADDVDIESFTLQRFLKLASEGQTVAVDMLFAPEWAWTNQPHPIWHAVIANRARLLTRQSASFVGYCRSQANKYGIRGSRVAAARRARDFLKERLHIAGPSALSALAGDIRYMVEEEKVPHMAIVNIPSQAGTDVLHWEVCNKKMPYTASVKSALEVMDRVVKEYGHRALEAESNQGVDWKALSHAVRIGQQAIELLEEGRVSFPRPNAAFLLAIKAGEHPYSHIGDLIDGLLVDVEDAARRSSLPATADNVWIDSFVEAAHREVVEGWIL